MNDKDYVVLTAYSHDSDEVVEMAMSNREVVTLTAFAIIGAATVMSYGAKIGKLAIEKIKEKTSDKES